MEVTWSQVWALWNVVHDSNMPALLLDNFINMISVYLIGCHLWYSTLLCSLISHQHNFDWTQALFKVFCHTTHFHHCTNTVLICYGFCSTSCILLCSYTISSTQFWYRVVVLQGSLSCCAPSSFHQHTCQLSEISHHNTCYWEWAMWCLHQTHSNRPNLNREHELHSRNITCGGHRKH
jgi:hypothetical protein